MKSKQIKAIIKKSNLGLSCVLGYQLIKRKISSKLSDEQFAIIKYKKAGLGLLDIKNPKTFDEKLWWLKIYYRDPLMVDCTDKIKVREYVKEKGFGYILNETYGVYEDTREICWDTLPEELYFKTNHSSATNIYIKNINNIDKKFIINRLNLHLKRNHYSLSREWNYKDIERKFFSERVLKSDKGLIDYRFLCSYGNVNGLFIDADTADQNGEHNDNARRNVYDKDFNLLDVTVSRPRFDITDFNMPTNILEMKKIAEKLSEPFPFCRVDLYNIDEKIIFGELTFFHAGGINNIEPKSFQMILGEWITLPTHKV